MQRGNGGEGESSQVVGIIIIQEAKGPIELDGCGY